MSRDAPPGPGRDTGVSQSRYLGWARNSHARRSRTFEMRVEVVNIHAETLRGRAERLRTRQALVRPDGPEHDDVRTELRCACRTNCPDSGTENNSMKPKVAQSQRIAPRASLYRRMGKIVCMTLPAE